MNAKDKEKPKCKPRGVSLPEDVNEAVDQRLRTLAPKVKGFSHYVQLLIDHDLKCPIEDDRNQVMAA